MAQDDMVLAVVAIGGMMLALAIGVTLGLLLGGTPFQQAPVQVRRDEAGRVLEITPGGS